MDSSYICWHIYNPGQQVLKGSKVMKDLHEEGAALQSLRVDILTDNPNPVLSTLVLPHGSEPRCSAPVELTKQQQPKDVQYLLATNTYPAVTQAEIPF